MNRLVLACILSMHCFVQATTLPSIQVSELFRDAEIVALVEVTAGETMGTGENTCGAKYSALVLDSFKGTSAGKTIEFGNYYGYEIGGRYVLFLVGPGRRYEPVMSTNSMHQDTKAEYERRCSARLRRNTVMHSGNGALKVDWVTEFNYEEGVAVPTRYVTLPSSIATVPAKITEMNERSRAVWVRLPDFTKALRGLGK